MRLTMLKPTMMRLLTVATALLLLAGCGAAKPVTYAGEDADKLAALITECDGIRTEGIGAGAASGLESSASCTLDGHKIYVNSWGTAADADLEPLFAASRVEAYWAAGPTWAVTPGDDETVQMQITNDAAGLLGQVGVSAEANLDAQRAIATTAAAALGGEVKHVRG